MNDNIFDSDCMKRQTEPRRFVPNKNHTCLPIHSPICERIIEVFEEIERLDIAKTHMDGCGSCLKHSIQQKYGDEIPEIIGFSVQNTSERMEDGRYPKGSSIILWCWDYKNDQDEKLAREVKANLNHFNDISCEFWEDYDGNAFKTMLRVRCEGCYVEFK
jgi:hypothetical protein